MASWKSSRELTLKEIPLKKPGQTFVKLFVLYWEPTAFLQRSKFKDHKKFQKRKFKCKMSS